MKIFESGPDNALDFGWVEQAFRPGDAKINDPGFSP
jgi:hypothetical protein